MSSIKWLPLESNPEVMNKFLESLGVPPNWAICDVIGLDDELLAFIPSPVLAFILLFPHGQAHEAYIAKMEEEMASGKIKHPSNLFFMKQTIRNACGTVALLHALANCRGKLNLNNDASLKKFLQETENLSPEDRGKLLETSEDIGGAHETLAQQGQTEAPNIDAEVNLHFIALVNVDGKLYELDGRRNSPVYHGPTSESTFTKDAAKICKDYIQRDPDSVQYTVLALAASS